MATSPPLLSPELNQEGQPSAREAPASPQRSEEEAHPLHVEHRPRDVSGSAQNKKRKASAVQARSERQQ
jgi:hypothetical protein